jgi:integrase
MSTRACEGAGKSGPMTVATAMDAYLEFLENNRKSAEDARYRDQALIRPRLGDIEIAALKADKIRKWLVDVAKTPPRLRTREGEKQNYRKIGDDHETRRKRRATANRTLTVLKAALNMAWREGKVATNSEWHRVEPFENVDAARIRYLSVTEGKRLLNACDRDFRKMVQAGLETGARYGELASLQVHDFNPDAGTIAIRQSKAGKPRHIVLTDEGVAFFKQACAGRAGSEIMFRKATESAWLKSHQKLPMAEACKRAKITPPIGFHGLRHTWASLAVMAGVPLLVVAKNLGHSDTRMVEKHYGHLAPSYIADAIRAGAPRFGFKPDKKIAALAGRT